MRTANGSNNRIGLLNMHLMNFTHAGCAAKISYIGRCNACACGVQRYDSTMATWVKFEFLPWAYCFLSHCVLVIKLTPLFVAQGYQYVVAISCANKRPWAYIVVLTLDQILSYSTLEVEVALFCSLHAKIAFVVNVFTRQYDFGWRITLGIQCLSGSTLAIGMLFLPESPR